ncbi:hypothetical protein DFJ77DRAFT_305530 [Powellomyces hirtus]|nr:hypothetical protein DFJ77DRAFT_305530 [Powellomyces hirtus]
MYCTPRPSCSIHRSRQAQVPSPHPEISSHHSFSSPTACAQFITACETLIRAHDPSRTIPCRHNLSSSSTALTFSYNKTSRTGQTTTSCAGICILCPYGPVQPAGVAAAARIYVAKHCDVLDWECDRVCGNRRALQFSFRGGGEKDKTCWGPCECDAFGGSEMLRVVPEANPPVLSGAGSLVASSTMNGFMLLVVLGCIEWGVLV